MRTVNRIVLHCSATDLNTSVDSIKNYWRNVLKWRNPGYHYIIEQDGNIVQLLPVEKVSNGVQGFNADSVHICTIGGKFSDDRTQAQRSSQKVMIQMLRQEFGHIPVVGHRDLSPDKNGDGKITRDEWLKLCPNYDVANWLRSVGL